MPLLPAAALKSLDRAHAAGRLAHAYLVSGGDAAARRGVAAGAASLALGLAPSKDAATEMPRHPELRVVEPESVSRRISVEAVRELSAGLALRSSDRSGRKVGVILDADRLTPQASNAFLKTLEEPSPGVLLVLESGRPEAMLETILSRCVRVDLLDGSAVGELTPREREVWNLLDAWAARAPGKNGGGVAPAFRVLREFLGVMASAKEAFRGEEDDAHDAEKERYDRRDHAAWLDEQEARHKQRAETRYQAERERLVGAVARWWGAQIRARAASSEPAGPAGLAALDLADLLRRTARIELLHEHLGRNVHEALAFEAGFLEAFG